jgi:hypothetical protein
MLAADLANRLNNNNNDDDNGKTENSSPNSKLK